MIVKRMKIYSDLEQREFGNKANKVIVYDKAAWYLDHPRFKFNKDEVLNHFNFYLNWFYKNSLLSLEGRELYNTFKGGVDESISFHSNMFNDLGNKFMKKFYCFSTKIPDEKILDKTLKNISSPNSKLDQYDKIINEYYITHPGTEYGPFYTIAKDNDGVGFPVIGFGLEDQNWIQIGFKDGKWFILDGDLSWNFNKIKKTYIKKDEVFPEIIRVLDKDHVQSVNDDPLPEKEYYWIRKRLKLLA